MNMDWKETARDFLALGSIPFYAIVIIRMMIIPEYKPLVAQLVVSFIAILALLQFVKFEHHIAQGIPIAVFTSLGYKDMLFAIFAALLVIGLIFSANYLKIKKDQTAKGTVVGIIVTVIAYYAVNWLF